MSSSLKKFKTKALRRPGVKDAYDALDEEFRFSTKSSRRGLRPD